MKYLALKLEEKYEEADRSVRIPAVCQFDHDPCLRKEGGGGEALEPHEKPDKAKSLERVQKRSNISKFTCRKNNMRESKKTRKELGTMKRTLVVMVALLAMVAFVSGVMAQAPAKTEKPAAPAPEKAAAAPTSEKAQPAAGKPKDEKSGAVRFGGTVTGYEAGKMIKVKGSDDKEATFGVTKKTKVKGEVKQGVRVTIAYKKDGDKMVATAINVSREQKLPKKAREKAAEKAPEKK